MDESRPETSNANKAFNGTGANGNPEGTRPPSRMMSAAQRPASRRRYGEAMTARQRPDSRMSTFGGGGGAGGGGDVPQRPGSRMNRLQSAMRPGSSFRQGTAALRTATARPPSGITGGALPIHAAVNVVDRPVTQQGVSGLRTARTGYGNRRMVHDKTYFLGILHTKMSEINSEITKLSGQIEALAKEQSTYIAYETRVKEKAAELQELHGELTDYNILADMLASEKDKSFLEDELRSLKRENEDDSARIESIYNRRRDAERIVTDLEQKIEDERNKAQRLIESLSPNLRDRYETFQKLNSQLQTDMENLQFQLDELNSRKSELYDKVSRSELKKKAAELEEELLEAEEKRDTLAREAESHESPEEERERLLNQVKIDNAEIGTLERQINETNDFIRQVQEEIQNIDQEIEENDSDRQQKFRELRKREVDMEEFMSAFEDNKAKEMENLVRIEAEVLSCVEKISRNVHLAATLPEAGQTFMELREDLEFKEEEFDKTRYTTEMVEYRNETLKKQLENFENLEEKMKTELQSLKDKLIQMQNEIQKFEDIEIVKSEGAERNRKLQKELIVLEQRSKKFVDALRSVTQEHAKLKSDLENNEVHRQLSSLEKKWAMLEESNFSVSSFLKAKKAETDYEGLKTEALTVLKDLNSLLQIK